MYSRILTVLVSIIVLVLVSFPVEAAKKQAKRDLSKEFDDLTPSEQIAIRAAAKAAYKAKKLETLTVCADPGNMPLSNIKEEASRTSSPLCSARPRGRGSSIPGVLLSSAA